MNKAEFLKELEFRLGSKQAALDALEAVTETVIRSVAKGEKVSISGFGVFERAERAARVGRNPKAGVAVAIPRHKAPAFRPSQLFKDWVRDPRTLPREGTGALISRADKLALKRAIAVQAPVTKPLSKAPTPGRKAKAGAGDAAS